MVNKGFSKNQRQIQGWREGNCVLKPLPSSEEGLYGRELYSFRKRMIC
jgi:hypothetical protein